MRKNDEAQLPLLELPTAPEPSAKRSGARARSLPGAPAQVASRRKSSPSSRRLSPVPARMPPRMPPALIAKHASALLAEIDRMALAQRSREDEVRAVHLAQLFTAAERAEQARAEAAREVPRGRVGA